jgi:hypothetical protein
LKIAPIHEAAALRLLRALVLGWDRVSSATQEWLLSEAAILHAGFPSATVSPAEIMSFIKLQQTAEKAGNLHG